MRKQHTTEKPVIIVVFHKSLDEFSKVAIIKAIQSTFNADISIASINIDLKAAYNVYRKQYDAEKIFEILQELSSNTIFLGALGFDLYVNELNFVFGVAMPYRGAVMSTWRLQTNNMELYSLRILKTVRHELGHVFGLLHCDGPCVMRFANSLMELDAKPATFCKKCRYKLVSFSILKQG